MKIAFISDVHSNYEALKTVLEDIQKRDVQQIIHTGDLVGYNTDPNRCIELIKKYKVMCIQGNHDLNAVTLENIKWFNEWAQIALRWTQKRLNEDNKNFLLTLPKFFEAKDKNSVYAVHGSPKDPLYEYLTPTSPDEIFKDFFEKLKVDLLVTGHTHIPDLKRFGNKVYLNPGSVGQPRDNNPKASYAIVDLSNINLISFHRIEYDIDTTAKKVIKAGLPEYLAERLYKGR